MKSYPTKYNNRIYRSRNEARWACTFDAMGWHYEYEAVDYETWMPDFLLIPEENFKEKLCHIEEINAGRCFHNCRYFHTLEQKPIAVEVKSFVTYEEFVNCGQVEKMQKSDCPYPILMLGSCLHKNKIGYMDNYNLALMKSPVDSSIIWALTKDKINSYPYSHINALWQHSGNVTQWMSPVAVNTY